MWEHSYCAPLQILRTGSCESWRPGWPVRCPGLQVLGSFSQGTTGFLLAQGALGLPSRTGSQSREPSPSKKGEA